MSLIQCSERKLSLPPAFRPLCNFFLYRSYLPSDVCLFPQTDLLRHLLQIHPTVCPSDEKDSLPRLAPVPIPCSSLLERVRHRHLDGNCRMRVSKGRRFLWRQAVVAQQMNYISLKKWIFQWNINILSYFILLYKKL